jgi:predicted DNA-binding transcriptional regulator AlpA
VSESKFLRCRAVCQRYGVSPSTVYAWVAAKKFPAPVQLVEGGQASGWAVDELEAFDAKRIAARELAA